MSAERVRKPAAAISRLPANQVLLGLNELIEAAVDRAIEARGLGRQEVPGLAEYRARAGLSIAELALLSGVSKSYLSDLERGRVKHPNFEILNKIARALKVEESGFRMAMTAEQRRGFNRG